jgi:hypothetical protein
MTIMKEYFDTSDGSFIKTWVSALVIFFILTLAYAIFSPLINTTFSDLVDVYAWNNPQLLSAKHLVVLFFNGFSYFCAVVILIWATIASLKREEDQFRR